MKGKQVSVERRKEIEKENEVQRKALEGVSVLDVVLESTEDQRGERYYSREFKTIYNGVRRGLVHLQKQKKYKVLSAEETYAQAIVLLQNFVESV